MFIIPLKCWFARTANDAEAKGLQLKLNTKVRDYAIPYLLFFITETNNIYIYIYIWLVGEGARGALATRAGATRGKVQPLVRLRCTRWW